MAHEAELIIRTLDRHLTAPGTIRLLGGAALVLGYGLQRATEDADLLLDDREAQALIDEAGFAEAVEATNRELEERGLYLTHIWGPEQQILTPEWREHCRAVHLPGLARLSVEVLGPVDLVLSKLCRADSLDLEDVAFLVRTQKLQARVIGDALDRAQVPEDFREILSESRRKLEALLVSLGVV